MQLFNKKCVMKRIVSGVLSVALITTSVFTVSGAKDLNSSAKTGTYHYNLYEGANKQGTDTFEYDDAYFMKSSYDVDAHLVTLSAQATLASRNKWGDKEDKYEQDPSNGSENVENFLKELGFSNVESNEWYHHEMLDNSMGVALGYREIEENGKKYTLLAIIPRSGGYRQEWAGNANVGTGAVHQGFFEARDEVLRFTKQYLSKNKIDGNLKVWIAGFSRGGAVSNALGGFFADGGSKYFGENVTVEPTNIYCYTFATPRTITSGATKSRTLSVSAARGGTYQYDTPGEAYTSSAQGNVNPSDPVYSGIHNYPFAYDFVTYLPLDQWGYTYYGKVCTYEGATEEQMIVKLKELDTYAYNEYAKKAPSYFHEKVFDVAALDIKDKEGGLSGEKGLIAFLNEKINTGLQYFSTTTKFVSEGYQEAFAAMMGMDSMAQDLLNNYDGVASKLTQPILFSYLAYASEKLVEEGVALDEDDAAAIAIEQIIEYATGESIDMDSYTVDEFIETLGNFVYDNEKDKGIQELEKYIDKAVPSSYASIAKNILGVFYPGSAEQGFDVSKIPLGKIAIEFLKACAKGAVPTSAAYSTESNRTPEGARQFLYTLTSMMSFLSSDMDKINKAIDKGNGQFEGFVTAVLYLMKKYTPETGGTQYYDRLADAADGEFKRAFTQIDADLAKKIDTEGLYNEDFKKMLHSKFETMNSHVTEIRELLMELLFTHNGPFNTEYNINSIATFAGNASIITMPHCQELCVSYGKAMPIGVTGISVSPTSTEMVVGDSTTLQVTITPEDASSKDVIFTSNNDSVATVSSIGVVTGVGEGNAVITVKTPDGKFSAKCEVKVSKINPTVTPPDANERITYTGEPMELSNTGNTDGGTLYYGLGTEDNEPTEWSTSVPKATEPGEYYVWYKVVGDNKYNDVKPTYVGESSLIVKESDNVISVDPVKDIALVKDSVLGENVEIPLHRILAGDLYRVYDPIRGEHLYTMDVGEVIYLEMHGWRYESDSDTYVVDASQEYAVPVYRLYNPYGGGTHFYTENAGEAKYLSSIGWNYEGISHYVYKMESTEGIPVYRLYNPYSPAAEHLWTINEGEAFYLVSIGWLFEGACCKIEEQI